MTAPIACTLTADEQRCQADALLPGLVAIAASHDIVPDGWRLTFAPAAGIVTRVAAVVERERQCCAFLRFTLVVPAANEPTVLTIDGPPGTGDFLASLLSTSTSAPTSDASCCSR